MANWSPLVLLQMMVHVSISLNFITHPEANLSLEQKIKKHGFPLEVHEVVTEDNYILTLHRVPYGRRPPNNNSTRSPVLLVHGMGGQVEYFLVLGKRSLVYYLADKGLDVWMLNVRGTTYSQKHKYFDIKKDMRYWKFSYHEIGVYDIPASIDYIVNKTNQKVFLIGHSQGNTCSFVMTTEKPEYNEKIKVSVAYATSVILKYMDYPLAKTFSYLVHWFELLYDILGMGTLLPGNDVTSFLIKFLCSETTYFSQFCIHVLSVIGSHESKLLTKEIAALVFSIPPANIAAMQLFHFMQNLNSGKFRQYDHGETGNLKRYKTKTPPEYNLTKSVAPVAIFYSEKDDIASLKGISETIKALPNVIFSYKVPYRDFNHIDFIFARNASSLVYKRTVQFFKDFDNGKLRSKH